MNKTIENIQSIRASLENSEIWRCAFCENHLYEDTCKKGEFECGCDFRCCICRDIIRECAKEGELVCKHKHTCDCGEWIDDHLLEYGQCHDCFYNI